MFSQVRRDLTLKRLSFRAIGLRTKALSSSAACPITLPIRQEGIACSVQQAASDVLAKNASILVFLYEVLTQARPQLPVAGVGAHTDDACTFVSSLASFKQYVDAV